jgi:hypothetical protein
VHLTGSARLAGTSTAGGCVVLLTVHSDTNGYLMQVDHPSNVTQSCHAVSLDIDTIVTSHLVARDTSPQHRIDSPTSCAEYYEQIRNKFACWYNVVANTLHQIIW